MSIIILILAVFFTIDWFVAKRFDEIAQMKGQPSKKDLWWSILHIRSAPPQKYLTIQRKSHKIKYARELPEGG